MHVASAQYMIECGLKVFEATREFYTKFSFHIILWTRRRDIEGYYEVYLKAPIASKSGFRLIKKKPGEKEHLEVDSHVTLHRQPQTPP